MNRLVPKLWVLVFMATVLGGCRPSERQETVRSAYYWSTTFVMDSVKTSFIKTHRISRLYVRYFDVVMGKDGQAVPNATIRFHDAMPTGVEVVPTVFILNDCMRQDVGGMAQKLVRRILQMNETHDIGRVKEVQIDCDWTTSTELLFFQFLKDVKRELEPQGIGLSVTVRLHQLGGAVPPADRGVLMMYNTGNFTRLDDEHPILDMKVAEPYLRHLGDYGLPFSTAYPLFRWELLFRGDQFVGILHGDDLPVLPSDSIVVREPTLDDILCARQRVDVLRRDANDEVILFELNNYNITRFNPNDYETIYDNVPAADHGRHQHAGVWF